MKSNNTLTKENYSKKDNRVFKELNGTLKNGGTLVTLTEDQRFILTNEYSKSISKEFNIKSQENLYFEARDEKSVDTCVFNDLDAFNNLFSNYLSGVIAEAKQWITKNKLVYMSCGLEDFNTFFVYGYISMSDKQLIEKYTKQFKKEQQDKKQQEKNKKAEAKKIITVNNKKYKLVEEYNTCDCECGCDCWNGHCDCGCVECT